MKKKNKKFVYLTADGQKAQYYKTSGYELIINDVIVITRSHVFKNMPDLCCYCWIYGFDYQTDVSDLHAMDKTN